GSGLTTPPTRLSSQRRSLTPTPRTTTMKSLTKSISTPQLLRGSSAANNSRPDSGILNTIPDPRTPSPSFLSPRKGSAGEPPSTPPQHPDLSNEVALLSTKLINAINHQTTLDDSLQTSRHELEAAKKRIAQLEAAAAEDAQMMAMMVPKDDYERMESQLRRELAEERRQRLAVDKEKKRIESELENLTTALFEEANTMVAAARKDREASEKRNDQLKTQLNDAELLLASHQEQLHDLKAVMQQMSSDQDDNEMTAHTTTAPSTPGLVPYDKDNRAFEQVNSRPTTPNPEDTVPDHPLHFSHLISPVLRHDLQAFRDFQDLLKSAKTPSAPASRVGSGNYGGLNVMGLGNLANLSSASIHSQLSAQANGTESSLPVSGANSPRDPMASLPPLKEMRFYKRALAEDIEPTLRLDCAPGISWLARRTVLNSMTAGTLTIEPHPPVSKFRGPIYPCSLCGENRVAPRGASKDNRHTPDPWARKHRFRTSDEKDAQRYPLCDYCLARVRSCCDYIGFLRLCRDGHWRAESGDEEKSAWEESVRLRERMFWARLGGGVVPAYI
ncbi:Sec2p-domain-containing protein, partial [Saccharata proteae CBS 121410]